MKTKYYAALCLIAIMAFVSCKTEVKKDEVTEEIEVAEIKEQTLYEKLGGAEGISAIVDDIVEEHLKNENVAHFFAPLKEDPERFAQFKTHVKNFFGAGTGGSEEYSGRDMPGAHEGMGITEAEFLHAIDDIMVVLNKHGIEKNAKNEVLAILFSMKWAVVRQ